MPSHAEPAITPDVSRYLQTVLLPLADDLLRRIQAATIVLRDVDRIGMPAASVNQLEIVVVLLGDAERGALQLRKLCGAGATEATG